MARPGNADAWVTGSSDAAGVRPVVSMPRWMWVRDGGLVLPWPDQTGQGCFGAMIVGMSCTLVLRASAAGARRGRMLPMVGLRLVMRWGVEDVHEVVEGTLKIGQ
jgi:hypothetical protein